MMLPRLWSSKGKVRLLTWKVLVDFFLARLKRACTFFFCFGRSDPPKTSKPTVQEAVISLSTVFNIYQSPKFNSSFLKNGSWKTILSYWEGNFSTFITPQNCCSDPLAGLLESAPASPSLPPVGESEGFRGCKPEELLRCLWWNKLAFIFGQHLGFVGMIRAGKDHLWTPCVSVSLKSWLGCILWS